MSSAGRRIWRQIIASKPVDWFDADQRNELLVHCENRARSIELARRMAAEDVGSKAFRELAVTEKMISATLATSSRQLRLTVQHTIDRHETKRTEGGSALDDADDLVGGNAVRIRAVK